MAGWAGLIGAMGGQIATVLIWMFIHEQANRSALRGPRIVKTLNRLQGRFRNHAALWVTSVALPGFLFIRVMQIAFYPMLVRLLGFPRYRQAEWINVSRQKFVGLVGHDLIWCLYCDWMTGVYALGAEMLRNVESFWCPIRFASGRKCENCKLDFPDIERGWVTADADMAAVVNMLDAMYADGKRSWFGSRRVDLTINGKPAGEADVEMRGTVMQPRVVTVPSSL